MFTHSNMNIYEINLLKINSDNLNRVNELSKLCSNVDIDMKVSHVPDNKPSSTSVNCLIILIQCCHFSYHNQIRTCSFLVKQPDQPGCEVNEQRPEVIHVNITSLYFTLKASLVMFCCRPCCVM